MYGSETWAMRIEDFKRMERTDENDTMVEWIVSERKKPSSEIGKRLKKLILVKNNFGREDLVGSSCATKGRR